MGEWKAEGLQKFSFPLSDCILVNHLTNPKELEIQSLVSRLTEMHFYNGRSGRTDSLIEQHRKLSWRLNILVEEVQGLEMQTSQPQNTENVETGAKKSGDFSKNLEVDQPANKTN